MELENLQESLLRGRQSQAGFTRSARDRSRGGLANVIASIRARRQFNRNEDLQEQVNIAKQQKREGLIEAFPEETRKLARNLPTSSLEAVLTKRFADKFKEKELTPFEIAKQKARGKAEGEALGGGQKALTVREKEREKTLGKLEAKDITQFKGITSKLPELEQNISELKGLAKKATFTIGGQAKDFFQRQRGITTPGAQARTEFEAIVNNQVLPLLKDTFGAAFTQKEGETLKATLGDLNKSPEEKIAVLDRFIEQKKKDISSLGKKIGVQQPKQQLQNQTAIQQPKRLVFNIETGEFE
jgi:hypothetical protein